MLTPSLRVASYILNHKPSPGECSLRTLAAKLRCTPDDVRNIVNSAPDAFSWTHTKAGREALAVKDAESVREILKNCGVQSRKRNPADKRITTRKLLETINTKLDQLLAR